VVRLEGEQKTSHGRNTPSEKRLAKKGAREKLLARGTKQHQSTEDEKKRKAI